jgi:spermidine synthase
MTATSERNQDPGFRYSPRALQLIGVCFVLSGATGLIYEVLWARMLGLVFGATTLAISAVLAAFMGGLALGSALAARLARRITKPLLVYALIEVAVGLYALAMPVLFRGVDSVYAAVWQQLRPGFYGSVLSRFALALAVLVAPTTLMGATLPVLAGALVRSSKDPGRSIARFYTLNLVGAIAGTIAAGFFLLPAFGVRTTIWIAAATNLAIGAAAFLINRQVRDARADSIAEHSEEALSRTGQEVIASDLKFWLACAFISGFVTISMQVVWSRILSMIIGSSTYAFSVVLALFLAGLSIGAYAVSSKKARRVADLRRTLVVVQLLTALCLFVSIRITNLIPEMLTRVGFRIGVNSWPGLLALQIAGAALLIFVPAILMGAVMPMVLLRAEAEGEGTEARASLPQARVRFVGHSYALNTIGAIAGSTLTAFFFIPIVSTRLTIFLMAALCIVVAGIAYQPRRVTADRGLANSLAVGGVAIVLVGMFALWPRLNLNVLSIGAYDSYVRVLAKARGGLPQDTRADRPEDHQLLMYREGRTATVSVRRDWKIVSMAVNGRTNASDTEDMPTQVMLGHLGALVAPRADHTLMIGFATGVTAGSVLRTSIQTVECVEIEPAAVASSHFFEHVNNRPLDDPRLRVIIDDARTYLRVTPQRYDLLISEPSHPWVPGVANLFTREFFSLGRDRLQSDGVFVQWLQIYQLSPDNLRSVLATFHSVFPHVVVFQVRGAAKGKDLILLGSRAPLSLDRVAERMRESNVATDLARVGINSAEDVRAWFVCDDTRLGPAVAGAAINTDDNMLVETVAPREAFHANTEQNRAWIESLKLR